MTWRHTALVLAWCATLSGCGPERAGPAADGTAAAQVTERADTTSHRQPVVLTVDMTHHFAAFAAVGSFVTYDSAAAVYRVHDAGRAARRFVPASTFKILSSLVALDEGVVRDQHEVIPWDGVDRGDWWNGDMDMALAFRRSAAWFYQELVRRVGESAMRAWLERVDYGNATFTAPVDSFWLAGSLRVSAAEQVALLRRLRAGTLPFTERSQRIVRTLMHMESGDGYTLSGKTGWAVLDGTNYGWLVGWVETANDVHFFATQIESAARGFAMRRAQQEITRGVLRELGALP